MAVPQGMREIDAQDLDYAGMVLFLCSPHHRHQMYRATKLFGPPDLQKIYRQCRWFMTNFEDRYLDAARDGFVRANYEEQLKRMWEQDKEFHPRPVLAKVKSGD